MLDKQLMQEYNWTPDYTDNVLYEYMRFIVLRSTNLNLSPSDDIDKCWHIHLLNPVKYYDYCIKTFNKIIDHNPEMSYDQQAKKIRLANTILEYKKRYGELKYPNVWGVHNITHDDKSEIKLKIIFSLEPIEGTSHLKNSDMLYHGKTLTIKCNNKTTINDLRAYIFKEIILKNYSKYKIKTSFDIIIFDQYEKEILRGSHDGAGKYLTPDDLYVLNCGNTFTVNLHEMTNRGYC